MRVATEGALWGAVRDQNLLEDTVIVSDGAGQFRVGTHALWVHAERLGHKLVPTTPLRRKAVPGRTGAPDNALVRVDEAGRLRGSVREAVDLTRRDRLGGAPAGEQPAMPLT